MTLTLDLHLPRWLHTEGDAEFSEDRSYRYWLTRRWGPGPALMFVSLSATRRSNDWLPASWRRPIGD